MHYERWRRHGDPTAYFGMKLPEGEASFNWLYNDIRKKAAVRGHEWNLDKNSFRELTQGNCFYCGIEPLQISARMSAFNGHYIYNGIDRLNNSEGYTESNTVSCCWPCNRMKNVSDVKEFLSQVQRIWEHTAW
jgi:hypothetical protein